MTSQFDDPDSHERDELLTLAEVATLLRIPIATLRYWRNQQTGPHSFRIGRHVRYHRTDVDTWLHAQRHAGGSGAA